MHISSWIKQLQILVVKKCNFSRKNIEKLYRFLNISAKFVAV